VPKVLAIIFVITFIGCQKNETHKFTAKTLSPGDLNISTKIKGSFLISGYVKVDQKLKSKTSASDVLFVFVRSASSPTGPPLAVLRITQPKFPQAFTLTENNAMRPSTKFVGPFIIQAKLSKSGNAFTHSGDLLSLQLPKDVQSGSQGVDIFLAKIAK